VAFEQCQPALGLAQEVGAGDDLLAGIAPLPDAVGMQALERELLWRPLSGLRGGQPRQSMGEVEGGPAVAGFGVVAGLEPWAGPQRARAAFAAEVEREASRRDIGARAARAGACLEATADLQHAGFDRHLAAEHEASQLRGEVAGAGVVQ